MIQTLVRLMLISLLEDKYTEQTFKSTLSKKILKAAFNFDFIRFTTVSFQFFF